MPASPTLQNMYGQQSQREIDFNSPFSYNGYGVTFDTPENRANALTNANPETMQAGWSPTAQDMGNDYYRSIGYTGPLATGYAGGAESGDIAGNTTNNELNQWLSDQGYKWGQGFKGEDYLSGYFDKYGNPVGKLSYGTSKGDFLKAMSLPAIWAGVTALAGGFGGGTAAGAGGGATPGGFDFAATYGSPAQAVGQGTQLAAGEGFTGLGEAVGAGASDAGYLSAADAAGGLMPEYGTNAAYTAGLGNLSSPAYTAAMDSMTNPSMFDKVTGGLSKLGDLYNKVGPITSRLADLYQASQAKKGYQNMLNQQSVLSDAYAKNLRDELMRRDAAAGRRSNYAGREVELQAKLAQLMSGNMPANIAAQGQINNYNNRTVNDILGLGGAALGTDWKGMWGGLKGLFGG